MTEKEIEVIARGYDKYNGCYIVPFKKKVFGKTRIFFNVVKKLLFAKYFYVLKFFHWKKTATYNKRI